MPEELRLSELAISLDGMNSFLTFSTKNRRARWAHDGNSTQRLKVRNHGFTLTALLRNPL